MSEEDGEFGRVGAGQKPLGEKRGVSGKGPSPDHIQEVLVCVTIPAGAPFQTDTPVVSSLT